MKHSNSHDLHPPLLRTVKQTATIRQLGINRTYRMCRGGELPAIQIGNSYRISRSALEAWITARLEQHKNSIG